MAEAGNTATPPAGSGGIDQNALAQAVASAVAAALPAAIAEANRPITDALKGLQPAGAAQQGAQGGAADKAKPLTADEVTRIVGEQLRTFQQTTQQGQQRQQFQESKLKDLPAVYRDRLGADPAKWAAEEQQIRDQYKADFAAAGGTTPSVGGDNPGGKKPADTVDYSKLNATQAIELGLKSSKPERDGAAADAAAATTTTTAATGAAGAR